MHFDFLLMAFLESARSYVLSSYNGLRRGHTVINFIMEWSKNVEGCCFFIGNIKMNVPMTAASFELNNVFSFCELEEEGENV